MYQIVGVENVDYVSKRDNKRKQGLKLYCTYTDDGVEGVAVKEFYFSGSEPDVPAELKLGMVIRVFFNEWKSPVCAVEVEAA